MLEIHEIRENYKKFDDSRIRRIARNDAKSLREETVPILFQEIQRRNIEESLIEWVNAERRKLSHYELSELKNKVKKCNCVECKEKGELMGFEFRTLIGALIIDLNTDYRIIVCKKCGINKRRKSLFYTSLFGWWSVQNIIATPFELIRKVKAVIYEERQSDLIIEKLIRDNIGEITLGKDSLEILQELIIRFNSEEIGPSIDLLY